MQRKTKIIINADDWGLSKLFNKAISRLIRKKIVNSVSVMVNQKYIESKKLLQFNNISIGIHLQLSQKAGIKEIKSQVEKFRKIFGRLPSHLDGHQHCHVSPDNIKNVVAIAKKYSLPVRSRFNEDRKFLLKNKIKSPDLFISWHPERIEKLLEQLDVVAGDKIIELVCHPGFYDERCAYPYNKMRKKELNFLESLTFRNAVRNFQQINYYSTWNLKNN